MFELQKMHEVIIVKKLRLKAIFYRAVLYIRRNAVGIRLIWPETVIVMIVSKLFMENIRAPMRLNKLI